ncbi:MAG: protein-glutamate O-methyltransferase CheR [Agarilytica sp.]
MSTRTETPQLSGAEFQEFRDFLQKVAGIDLGDNKQYLVSTRLRRVLAEYECASLGELTKLIQRPGNTQAKQKVIDEMTTNETFWFRDSYPFDYLKSKILPELSEQRSTGRARIWSAACSSGQEPYSLSMMIEESKKKNFATKNLNVEIVATDLSSVILNKAKSGEYDRLSISRGLSKERLDNFFESAGPDLWRAKPIVKSRITFRPLNLQESFVTMGKFDVVFCRNVLIYFSAELKKDILTRIHATLKPGGALFLGSSESLSGASSLFEMVHCNPGVMYRAK